MFEFNIVKKYIYRMVTSPGQITEVKQHRGGYI